MCGPGPDCLCGDDALVGVHGHLSPALLLLTFAVLNAQRTHQQQLRVKYMHCHRHVITQLLCLVNPSRMCLPAHSLQSSVWVPAPAVRDVQARS